MLPAVKLYAKAHLLKDRQRYLKPVYSFRIYCEFVNQEFGIADDGAYSVPISNPNDLGKLCLLWNSALSDYRFMGLYRMCFITKSLTKASGFSIAKCVYQRNAKSPS